MTITKRQQTTLDNMWRGRAEAIKVQLEAGSSFTAAERATFDEYDTTGWDEITSRLWRARGGLLCSAATLCFEPGLLAEIKRDDHLTARVQTFVDSISADIRELCRCVAKFPIRPQETGKLPAKPKTTSPLDKMLNSPGKIIGNLKQAARFISKSAHDIPLMPEHLGVPPTFVEQARICVESARTLGALQAIEFALSVDFKPSERIRKSLRDDFLGVGKSHATLFANVFDLDALPFNQRVITHSKPDADALVSAWMAEGYILPHKRPIIRFASSIEGVRDLFEPGDCVVDFGGIYDPVKRLFDHRPPYFENRDVTCATKLVFQYLLVHNRPVEHLTYLTEIIHDGDAASRRPKSWKYDESIRFGLHAHIKLLRELADTDMVLYRASALWLDSLFGGRPRRQSDSDLARCKQTKC